MPTAGDPAEVREFLLGRQGPYADPRVALDPLDNLTERVRDLESEESRRLGAALLALLSDADADVATGATLGLGILHAATGVVRAHDVMEALDRLGATLERPPVGFAAATGPTILADLAIVAARSAGPGDDALVGRLLDDLPGGVAADMIGSAVAPQFPDLVVAHARRWFTAADTGTLVQLPTHWHRVAMAGALRPFASNAVAHVAVAAQMRGWSSADAAVLEAVMCDRYPALTAPAGIGGDDWWWIEAGSPYGPVVWRSRTGAVAVEVLVDGPGLTLASTMLPARLVAAYESDGVAALAEVVEALRR
jgi:hypothetical protein